MITNKQRAKELIDHFQIVNFPHNTDQRSRKQIIDRLYQPLQGESEPPMSAEEQYQAQLLRMKGG